jgi:hypothetical protein
MGYGLWAMGQTKLLRRLDEALSARAKRTGPAGALSRIYLATCLFAALPLIGSQSIANSP